MFKPKGYFTDGGYIGFLPDGRKQYFPTYPLQHKHIPQRFRNIQRESNFIPRCSSPS